MTMARSKRPRLESTHSHPHPKVGFCERGLPSPGQASAGQASARRDPIRILRLAQVLEITGLGKTTLYELQSQGSFPMRVKITDHCVGWVEQDVQTWLQWRVALSAERSALSLRGTIHQHRLDNKNDRHAV
jgi:prophage regulatory protein